MRVATGGVGSASAEEVDCVGTINESECAAIRDAVKVNIVPMLRNGVHRSYTRTMLQAFVVALSAVTAPLITQSSAQSDEPPIASTKREKAIDFAKERAWWSYAPISASPPPQITDDDWCVNEIDQFILAKLRARGLDPAPAAERATLIRRAFYDLTGLPPTPEQVASFVSDPSLDAWPRVIDTLLASPHYGERWGRHWLDLVRYADTNGFERDSDKPEAWRYRDWVIAAFNSDKPYDRFLIEQLAGDEVADRNFDTMVATGYYRLGMWDDEVSDLEQALADDLDSIVDTTARTMLGMALGCARCHDHKGDPIRQRDYYTFAAHFAGLKPYKSSAGNSIESASVLRVLSPTFGSTADLDPRTEQRARRASLIAELADLESRVGADSSPSTLGLVAHYPFETSRDAPESERAEASSTIAGGAGAVVDARWGESGKSGLCATFDGGDDRISIPALVRDDFTITFWVKSDRIAPGSAADPRWFTGAGLVDGEVAGIVDDFGISMIGNGMIAAGVGNPETFVNSSLGFNDGQWHHVALTRSTGGGAIGLFVDGIEEMSAIGGRQSLNATASLTIGALNTGGGAFTGALDEVRIYQRQLSANELLSLATGTALPESIELAVKSTSDSALFERWRSAHQSLAELKAISSRGTDVLCASERAEPAQTHLLIRGSPHAPAELVLPAIPEIVAEVAEGEIAEVYASESSGRRLALAKWITDPQNPLTARTMANRLWQFHFGRGLCPTPNDFGHFGELPTHPELLDWLATRFAFAQWSMKHMHRLMMLSATYQMTSTASDEALSHDPPNDLLSRFRLRRLESEEIRDSVLAVNGSLNEQVGGPGFRPPLPAAVLATSSRPDEVWPLTERKSWSKRSVYMHAKRSLQHPLLAVFDQADIDAACPVRFSTVQPTQALTMLNGEFTNTEARVFAERVRSDAPNDLRAQVERAMGLAYCRSIDPSEVDEGLHFVADLQSSEAMSELDALATLTLALLNSNEFMHVD